MNQYATIVDLLNKICNDYRNLTWKMSCNYVNGLGKTILEIFIIEHPRSSIKRKIAFQLESGRVVNHNIQELKGRSENITDLLLDLINLEKKKLHWKWMK
jgi:hypothetical protein